MLVDLTMAKRWLRVEHDSEDLLIQDLIDQASDVVTDYIKRPDHGWTAPTVPPHVRAAILHVLSRLYGDRGGELDGGALPDHVRDLLRRDRDPAVA
jgi:hypothetical protein